jgi:hypothetical protein
LQVTTNDGRFVAFNVPRSGCPSTVSPDDTGNVLVDALAGGVTVLRMVVNNAPPEVVDVSGRVTDLHGAGVGGVTLSVVGGDPLPHKTRCPNGPDGLPLTEREGLCYADTTQRVNGVEKVPIPCDQADSAYPSYRSHSAERDGYCAAVGTSDPAGGFSLALGSYADQVIKSSGPGLIDTYTFGVTIGQQPLTGVPGMAIKRDEIEGLAAAAGLTREAGSGLIWGQTTTASLGTVDAQGLLTPLDCSGWEVPDGPSDCGGLGTPGALATGSFNADGLRDLAVIDATSANPAVTIWLNKGDGSFVRSQRIVVPGANGPCLVGEIGCGGERPVALLVLDMMPVDSTSSSSPDRGPSRCSGRPPVRVRGVLWSSGGLLRQWPPPISTAADCGFVDHRPADRAHHLVIGHRRGFASFYPPLSRIWRRTAGGGARLFEQRQDPDLYSRRGMDCGDTGDRRRNSLTPIPCRSASADLRRRRHRRLDQNGFNDVVVVDRSSFHPASGSSGGFFGLQTPTSFRRALPARRTDRRGRRSPARSHRDQSGRWDGPLSPRTG